MGRYYKSIPDIPKIQLEEYEFASRRLWFPGVDFDIYYEDESAIWEEFLQWILYIRDKYERRKKKSSEYMLGDALLYYVKEQDTFGTRLMIKAHKEEFDRVFMVEETPKCVRDLVDVLLYEPKKHFGLVVEDDIYYNNKYYGMEQACEAYYGSIWR